MTQPVADAPEFPLYWAGNVLRHIDTSTNNTQPKENQMIESSDEELAEAIDEAHRELDALRPGNYQPNSLNTGDQGRVLPTAARNVNGQRRADYGPALESFQRIADIANAGLGHKLAEDLTPEDICWLLLYALKGSRAAQGLRTGTFHHDTYADTAGYAAVAEIIHLQREGENA